MSEIYMTRSQAVAARELGGEMMIMSGRDSSLFSLNPTASAIWQAADGATPLWRELLVEGFIRRFPVETFQRPRVVLFDPLHCGTDEFRVGGQRRGSPLARKIFGVLLLRLATFRTAIFWFSPRKLRPRCDRTAPTTKQNGTRPASSEDALAMRT